MNVLCPFCQKMQTVPDSQAGQTTACANCHQSFPAPSLPMPLPEPGATLPSVAAPSAGAPSKPAPVIDPGAEIYNLSMEPTPPVSRAKPTPVSPPPQPKHEKPEAAAAPPPRREKLDGVPPPSGTDYVHHFTLMIRPPAVALVAPIALLLVVVFWLFSWTGAYPGGHGVYTQSALQTLYGGHSYNAVGEKVFHQEKTLADKMSWNPTMFIYVLVTLAALAFVLTPMLTTSGRLRLPNFMEHLWPWRWLISLGLATTALLLVLAQSSWGFGLETAVGSIVQDSVASAQLPTETPEEQQIVDLTAGRVAGGFHMHRTLWWRLALIAHLSAVLGLAAEWFLHRRTNALPPRADFQW